MSRKEDQRERTIERLTAHLLRTGLSETSLRQLAAAAGISDRMLLYYFADKAEALGAALGAVAAGLAAHLDRAIPAGRPLPPAELIAKAAALTLNPSVRPYMSLWIEVVAATARREEPYVRIASAITAGFLDWVEARLAVTGDRPKRATATAILALIDGIALIDICLGRDKALEAAEALEGNAFTGPRAGVP